MYKENSILTANDPELHTGTVTPGECNQALPCRPGPTPTHRTKKETWTHLPLERVPLQLLVLFAVPVPCFQVKFHLPQETVALKRIPMPDGQVQLLCL